MGLRHRLATACLPAALERWALLRPPHPRVSVLMYHEVLPDELDIPSWLVVKTSEFMRQMEYLAAHFDVLTLDEAAGVVQDSELAALPGRPKAVITFDDGYAGNLHYALPILESLRLPFTVYVSTSKILRGGRYWYDDVICSLLTRSRKRYQFETTLGTIHYAPGSNTAPARWAAIQEILSRMKQLPQEERQALVESLRAEYLVPELRMMSVSELKTIAIRPQVTLGNHTHWHDLLDTIPLAQAKASILEGQAHINAWTSQWPKHFSYPNGNYTEDVVQLVRLLDFHTAVTTESRHWTRNEDHFRIPRTGIGRFDNFRLFRAKLAGLAH